MRIRAPRLTYANVVATLAVFLALGGLSYAAVELPARSVGTAQLQAKSVTPDKLAFPLGATGRTDLTKRRLGKLDGCDAPEPPGQHVATPCPLEWEVPGSILFAEDGPQQTITLSGSTQLLLSGVADLRDEGPTGTAATVTAAIGVDDTIVAEPTVKIEGQGATEMPLEAIVKLPAGRHHFAVVFRADYYSYLPGEVLVYPVTLWAAALPRA